MQNRKHRRAGFSLIEIISAVVILAVVATATVSTIAPMREKSRSKIDDQAIARLNGLVQAYYMENGAYPDAAMNRLITGKYLADATPLSTPYGGRYTFNATTQLVTNPRRPAP
jgi:general secretion pathway protein G